MPYAEGRIGSDADAHLMETATWMFDCADAQMRAMLKPLDLSKAGNMAEHLRTAHAVLLFTGQSDYSNSSRPAII